jgi:hypothetical protein
MLMNPPKKVSLLLAELSQLIDHYNQDHHLNEPDRGIDLLVEQQFRDDLLIDDGWDDIIRVGKSINSE